MLSWGVSVIVLGLAVAGIVVPFRVLRHWHGGWRAVPAVPMVKIGFVALRIIVDVADDPTSHNLWPFEIVIAGLASFGVTAVLLLLHSLGGKGK